MLQDRINQVGTPRTEPTFRPVKPQITVLIDLGALFARQPHFRRPNILVVPQMEVLVVGRLDAWVITSIGWLGFCHYKIKLAAGEYLEQHHLVPAAMLRKPTEWDLKQARMRGELE